MTQGQTLNKPVGVLENGQIFGDIATKNAARIARTKKMNFTLLGSHIAVVLIIVGVVVVGYRAPVEATSSQAANSVLDQQEASVDQIAAASVASSVAKTVDLSVGNNVQNLAISLNAKTELAQTDSNYLTKPQIVQQNGRKGILAYSSKAGDTVKGLAVTYGVSEDTIRWANSLTSDAIPAGKNLQIPGVTGVVYTVKAGDDAAKLAEKYKADRDRIITYNDLELTGLKPGAKIVIPEGVTPENERPGYRSSASFSSFGSIGSVSPSYAGNGYVAGYCTFYAYNRRAELGRPIPGNMGNAVSWASYARAAGFTVNNKPAPGAVFQHGGGWGGLGHVAIVEKVNADGSIELSEMNYAGYNIITGGPHSRSAGRVIPAGQVGNYNYIHDR